LVGAAIGVLSWLSFLILKKPLSCSTSFASTSGMIERLLRGKQVEEKLYYQKVKLAIDWQWMLVAGMVFGSLISALLSGDFSWQWVPVLWASTFGNAPLVRIAAAAIGGIFLGFGARWADGCTSGHGISGTMQLTLSSWVSAIFFFVGGILTAFILFRLIG
jgi:hypothetical protein